MTPSQGPMIRDVLRKSAGRDTRSLAVATLQAFRERDMIPEEVRLVVSYGDGDVAVESHAPAGGFKYPSGIFHLFDHEDTADADLTVRRAAKIIETFYQAIAVGLFRSGAQDIYVLNAAPEPL